MDYNAGFWAHNLDTFVQKFKADSVNFVGLKWKSDDNKEYYSILVNACGYVVFELIGDKVSDESNFKPSNQLRFSFKSRHNTP